MHIQENKSPSLLETSGSDDGLASSTTFPAPTTRLPPLMAAVSAD